MNISPQFKINKKENRKEWTWYGSFLQHLEIGQKSKKIKILLRM